MSNTHSLFKYLALFSVVFLVGAALIPQSLSAEEDEESRMLTKGGTLSGSYFGGSEGVAVDGPWGKKDTDIFSEDKAPITGSVSRLNKRDWMMKVYNNSEDRYAVSVQVVEFTKDGKQLRKTSHSYVLKPKENKQKKIRAQINTFQAELRLASWKNLTPKKDKDEEGNESAAVEADRR